MRALFRRLFYRKPEPRKPGHISEETRRRVLRAHICAATIGRVR